MAKRGRKPKPPPLGLNGLGADDQRRLTSIVTRVERLVDDRKAIDEDIRAVLAEAKAMNFHIPTIRAAIRERAMPADKRQIAEGLRDSYRHALGMLADTPLGRAALHQADDVAEAPPRRAKRTKPSPAAPPAAEAGTTAIEPEPAHAVRPQVDEELAGQTVDGMRALREQSTTDAPEPSHE